MSEMSQLKESVDEIQTLFTQFKSTNDSLLEKKADGKAVADIEEKLAKIESDISAAEKKQQERIAGYEAMESRVNDLEAMYEAGGQGYNATKQAHDDHRSAFYDMLINGGSHRYAEKCIEAQEKAIATYDEQKRVDLTAGASGEFLLPEVIRAEVEVMEQKMSPVRQLIPVVQVTTNDFKQIVDILGQNSGWVGETGTRSVGTTPQLRQRAPSMGELYARPEATQWAAMDLSSVDGWLSRSVAEEFAKQEGTAVISGDGTNKPTGFLNGTPVLTADDASPLRSAEVLQYVGAPSPDDITEHLIMLEYALQSGYRAGAAYTFNSNTAGLIRRAKDSQGQYLWQPSLQAGEPPVINGKRFVVWEDMPDVAQSPLDFPIAFGNWGRGYLLVERSAVRVIRDEVTNPGFIRWYFFRREGGIILNNDAIKLAQR